MAIVRDYEIPGTGIIINDAYHVITDVKVEKRVHDFAPPPDKSRPDGLTAVDRPPGSEVYWKAGYIGEISITVWKDEQARSNNMKPIGFIGMGGANNKDNATIGTPGMDHRCKFFIDVASEKNYIEQAYDYVMTLDYYSNCSRV
jgi:hypothetical protein